MGEKFLRVLSGIDNLKLTAIFRIIVGLVIIVYGFIMFFLIKIDTFWTKIGIPSTLWALGLMFILDGQSILREYFNRDYNKPHFGNEHPLLIKIAEFIFIIGSILFLIKFYNSDNVSFYPLIIFLIAIFIIIVFYERISNFKINWKGNSIEVLINQKEGIEKREEIGKAKYGDIKFIPKGEEVKWNTIKKK